MFDIDGMAADVAEKLAEEMDDNIPDGMIQTVVGEVVYQVGGILTKAGEELKGAKNNDGDE